MVSNLSLAMILIKMEQLAFNAQFVHSLYVKIIQHPTGVVYQHLNIVVKTPISP